MDDSPNPGGRQVSHLDVLEEALDRMQLEIRALWLHLAAQRCQRI